MNRPCAMITAVLGQNSIPAVLDAEIDNLSEMELTIRIYSMKDSSGSTSVTFNNVSVEELFELGNQFVRLAKNVDALKDTPEIDTPSSAHVDNFSGTTTKPKFTTYTEPEGLEGHE